MIVPAAALAVMSVIAALLALMAIVALLLPIAALAVAAAAGILLRPVMFGGPLRRVRICPAVDDVELDLDQLLDVAQEGSLLIVAE